MEWPERSLSAPGNPSYALTKPVPGGAGDSDLQAGRPSMHRHSSATRGDDGEGIQSRCLVSPFHSVPREPLGG